MKTIRRLFASLVFALSFLSSPAGSTSFSTDQSDLWYIPAESGWGIQLVQRGSVIFATMFVYDQHNNPIWYVATMNSVGAFTWTGDLLLTSGPWFGTVPFNPNAVFFRKVGTMTWAASTVTTGTLTYSVDGVPVAKTLTRETLVLDDFSGIFLGALHGTSTACVNPAANITSEEVGGINVTQNGQNVAIVFLGENGVSCNFSGLVTQDGQFGTMSGPYSCSTGEVGNYSIFEMNVTFNTLVARLVLNSTNDGCQTVGYFGGIRHR